MKRGSSILEGMYDRIDAAIANVGRKKPRVAKQKYQHKQRLRERVLRSEHGTSWDWSRGKQRVITDRAGRRYEVHPISGSLTRVNREEPRTRWRKGQRVAAGRGA